MENIWSLLLENGLSFGLLGIAVWWFQSQYKTLQRKVDECHQQVLDVYKEENGKLIEVVERNTDIISNFSDFLKGIVNKI